MYTLVTVVERDITTQDFRDKDVRKAMEQIRDYLFEDIAYKCLGVTKYEHSEEGLDKIITAMGEDDDLKDSIETVRQLHGMVDTAIVGTETPYSEYDKVIGADIYDIERVSGELPLGMQIVSYDSGAFALQAWSNCNDDYSYDAQLHYVNPDNLPE